MRAIVDKDTCIGCGLCESICPSVFQMTESGLAKAVKEVSEDEESDASEAVRSCPVDAISWQEK